MPGVRAFPPGVWAGARPGQAGDGPGRDKLSAEWRCVYGALLMWRWIVEVSYDDGMNCTRVSRPADEWAEGRQGRARWV